MDKFVILVQFYLNYKIKNSNNLIGDSIITFKMKIYTCLFQMSSGMLRGRGVRGYTSWYRGRAGSVLYSILHIFVIKFITPQVGFRTLSRGTILY